MKKWVLRLVIVLLVLLVGVFVARNIIANRAVRYGVERVTGFPMQIGAVDLALFQSEIDVRNITLENPPEFPVKEFVDMPRLYVNYKTGSLISGEPHITEMEIELKELVIVRNREGEVNVVKLKGVRSPAEKPGQASTNVVHYRIDELRLKIGRVTYHDFAGATPTVRIVPVNLDQTYRNISDATDINRLVLLSALSKVKLPELPIDLAQLQNGLGEVTTAAGELLKGTTETIERTGKELLEGFRGVLPEKKK